MGLDIIESDIHNAYITAPTTDKLYTICGMEFGSENIGKKAIDKQDFYRTKSAE